MEAQKDELTLWDIIAPVKQQIYIGMGLAAVGSLTWLLALLLIRPIVRELLAEAPNIVLLWPSFGAAAALIAAGILFRVYAFNWSHQGAFLLEEILRTQLTAHLAKVPLGYVVTTGSGSLKKVLMDDVRSLHAFVADSTPALARGYATPLLAIIVMFIIDWRMALISLAVFPIGIIAMQLAFTDFAEGRAANDAAKEQMNRTIIEYIQGMQVVRTFDDGSASFRRYREALDQATQAQRNWAEKTQTGARWLKLAPMLSWYRALAFTPGCGRNIRKPNYGDCAVRSTPQRQPIRSRHHDRHLSTHATRGRIAGLYAAAGLWAGYPQFNRAGDQLCPPLSSF
ncbi:MAG: ABC transporter ATP-binding protein [Chloroflexota bacterium]